MKNLIIVLLAFLFTFIGVEAMIAVSDIKYQEITPLSVAWDCFVFIIGTWLCVIPLVTHWAYKIERWLK